MENDLETIGHAAATFQRHPAYILAALAGVQAEGDLAAGLPISHEATPVLRLDGLAYFRAGDIVRAIAFLSQRDAEKAMAEARKAVEATA